MSHEAISHRFKYTDVALVLRIKKTLLGILLFKSQAIVRK